MIVVMDVKATARDTGQVIKAIEESGLKLHIFKEDGRTVMGLVGQERGGLVDRLKGLKGVDRVIPIERPFKLSSLDFRASPSKITVGDVVIGGPGIVLMAGPCAVENERQMFESAQAVAKAGARILRGGAFKPRTSPYSFRGLGVDGLRLLRAAADEVGLPVVTEVLSPNDIDAVCQYADMLQVGARNMQNFNLLDELGRIDKPVLLKRGMMSTIEELLMSAEYILSKGNYQVVLCERGIRTFERSTRNTPDLAAIPVVKHLSHLPIIFDPSHSVGERRYVLAIARAALAAGADGLIVEVHPHPDEALCDGNQALLPADFEQLVKESSKIAAAVGRTLA
ncbi:MAG: 3-deoxy-7-phosphoheptulonate synthase [Planctomycetota bacterium]